MPICQDRFLMRIQILLSVLPLLLAAACLESTTGPRGGEEPVILLEVSGGLAGVEYALRVDGPNREVVGERCVSGCGFQEGDLLHGLTLEQSAYLAHLFRDAGIHQLDGTDFGTECCDQFRYELTYSDSEGVSVVQGTSEALPEDLRGAVATVAAYADNIVPAVVAMDTDPERWVRDSAILKEWGVSGDFAQLQVSYSGGCAGHEFDLVVYGGWKESYPVQVSAFLSHDANGDPCDAFLTEDLVFDLRPLKKAYQEAYGISDPGSTTVVIGLDFIPSLSSFSPIPLEYTF